jgi:low temperature requirement protein LtrA
VAVAQAADGLQLGLAEGHFRNVLIGYPLVFFAIWWAWMNFTWFASAYSTEDVVYRAGAARFMAMGMGTAESRRLALTVIALLEGAFVLCRATRSTDPMASAGEAAVTVVRSALDPVGSPAGPQQ